jgi:hypothetical protein
MGTKVVPLVESLELLGCSLDNRVRVHELDHGWLAETEFSDPSLLWSLPETDVYVTERVD